VTGAPALTVGDVVRMVELTEAAAHADLLHAADRSDEAMAHLKQAVAIFAEVGADAGDVQPEIWKLVEW